nr:MAG TPA: hypothetical protein [Caudoviricetes sp.]
MPAPGLPGAGFHAFQTKKSRGFFALASLISQHVHSNNTEPLIFIVSILQTVQNMVY